jgi:hypothetical protein
MPRVLILVVPLTKCHLPCFYVTLILGLTSIYVSVFRNYQISGTLKLPSTVISGVPQGCELGLRFFNAPVNDVCNVVTQSTFFFLFADDT